MHHCLIFLFSSFSFISVCLYNINCLYPTSLSGLLRDILTKKATIMASAADTADQVTSAMTLMRRFPPHNVDENLEHLITLVPEEEEELLQRIDQPLRLTTDTNAQKQFVICDYNRDGDSYRSPWTNAYFPEIPPEDRDMAYYPPENLRQLEISLNDVYDAYREL